MRMKQLTLDIGLARAPSWPASGRPQRGRAGAPAAVGRQPDPLAGADLPVGTGGSGKTHLLKAVQEACASRAPASAGSTLDAGAARLRRNWAVVLLDDVHLYTAVQQHAAFSWFVRRRRCSAACWPRGLLPPADLKLREDLRTRLGWGHVFQLHVLSEPERRAVLRQAADARGVFLSDEVMDFMLHRFSRDLGSLMQLLEHLDAYALQTQRAITIPLIKSMLENE
jgi:DnaA family protein